jgi:DNA-binding CsgD family transcriptional regulator
MQLLLPIFPVDTQMISPTLGVCQRESIVTYLHCGMPIYSHAAEDDKSFRYITSKMILQGLCRRKDIADCFHVTYDSVKRNVKKLEKLGDSGFFAPDKRKGSCYKLLPDVVKRMQACLDEGKSNCEIARLEGVSEGSVRYALRKGVLKKNG